MSICCKHVVCRLIVPLTMIELRFLLEILDLILDLLTIGSLSFKVPQSAKA